MVKQENIGSTGSTTSGKTGKDKGAVQEIGGKIATN